MGSKNLPLQQKGIYHNLPTFSPDVKGLAAIVTGANGISGFHTMRVLLESPERWSKVYAISRRPPPPEMMDLLPAEHRSRVEHVACDFLSKPEAIAEALKGQVKSADVVFFYSYLQPKPEPGKGAWSNAQELCDVNSALLANFLGALPLANLEPSRILLQTGAKNYGVHLGRARTPYVESDPRVTLEPNFYYPQEDILWKHCQANGASWNIVMPAWIIGAVNNAAMNALHPLAVYAAVQAHKNVPLHYPGDIEAWNGWQEHSSAMLTGYLSEWAVLEEHTKNQKFNASDGCPIPINRLWPQLAKWYGVPEVGKPELDDAKFTVIDPGADTKTPLGFGPPTKSRFTFTLSHWATQPENAKAWKEIMEKDQLTHNPFEDIEAHFTFGDAAAWGLALCLSTSKARYFGFTGYVDTLESLNSAYDELNKLGMLPPLKSKAQPMI